MSYDEYMGKDGAVRADTRALGNFIDKDREMVDIPHLSLIEVDLPEYERNGFGRALLKVIRFYFEDIGRYGVEGMSIGANSSSGHMIYADMNPIVVGQTHTEVHDKTPALVIKALYQCGLPLELVTLAALRYTQFEDYEAPVKFIDMYHSRSSWMEAHPFEVHMANIMALAGNATEFDWPRLISE